MTGLPKPTITRLTHTLSRLGYLKQVPNSSKFQLSVGVLSFGYSMLSNLSLRSVAHPLMKNLADYAEAAVAMATRDRLNMIYLDVVQGKGNVTMRRQVGTHLPIHLSSMGRACLAAMSEDERDFLLDAIRRKHAEEWPQIQKIWRSHLKTIRNMVSAFQSVNGIRMSIRLQFLLSMNSMVYWCLTAAVQVSSSMKRKSK